MSEPPRRRSRRDYEQGLPDHHDPTAGFAGAPPARSALTLRLVLAVFGLVVCVAAGIGVLVAGMPTWGVALFIMAGIALVDIAVIVRRKAQGEPG